jgi:hypothetical protein
VVCNMSDKGSAVSSLKTLVLGAALLAYPCRMFAQHGGGGGGSAGGGTGGGGLSGPAGLASGVSVNDDLKGFHKVLAVQATRQQIVEYNLMVKSTAAASAELQSFLEQLSKANKRPELAGRDAALEQALERARTENKKFLDGLSDRQKSGLKEIAKKLIKTDSDLAQKAKALDQEIGDTKVVAQTIANSAQSLEQTLASFRSQQLDLGEEMSIGAATGGQDSTFNLAPVKNTVKLENQPIAITTSGVVSKGAAEGGQNTFKLELTADLSDLQLNITDVLRAQLDKADRCGERIAIHSATLSALAPASLVVAHLHFERWACFGRDTVNEMVEGNGAIEVKLTPAVGEDGGLRLSPEIGRIDAEGLVGELLRSGSLGEALRDKVAESILSTVRQGADFKATLPSAAQGYTTLHRAQFQGTGSGKLMVVLEGEIRVSNEKVTALTSELKGRAGSQAPSQETMPETMPR